VKSDSFNVFIEQEAFRNIVIHTAQFAHFDLNVKNWREVYGFLSGYIDSETHWVHITDAFAITHGTHYGVEFKKPHYVLSAYLNLMIAEKNEFFVGWYHSHPGLSLFLSEVDVINQLAYQIVNEKAIALVFDFTKIIYKQPTLSLFQLDNPQFGASSAYHEVDYFIGGIKKEEEFDQIRELYYKIEADVTGNKIEPLEKKVKEMVDDWRRKTKTKLPEAQLYKKRKKKH
jgi:proteasome lid subunit RPN8/RPN11